jgi:thioredoxin reductase (NADPH)
LEVTDNGCIVVNREFQTAAAGVYAIGDVLCNHVKQAVIAAGDGSVAGIAVEKYLSGRKRMAFDWVK